MADLGNIGTLLTGSLLDSNTIRIGSQQIGPSPWISLGIDAYREGAKQSSYIRSGADGTTYYLSSYYNRFSEVNPTATGTSPTPVTTVVWG